MTSTPRVPGRGGEVQVIPAQIGTPISAPKSIEIEAMLNVEDWGDEGNLAYYVNLVRSAGLAGPGRA